MLTLALLLAAAAAPDRAADEAALRAAKLSAWPGFYRRQDAEGLAGFLADGFVAFQPDGTRQDKAAAVAWVRANRWAAGEANFRYDIAGIEFLGADAANVYGTGSYDGPGCRMSYTSANLFARQAGRWRPVFSHTSQAACAAP